MALETSQSEVRYRFISDFADKLRITVKNFGEQNASKAIAAIKILTAVLYNCYFVAAIYHSQQSEHDLNWCDDVGMLIILTIIAYCGLFYFKIFKPKWGNLTYSLIAVPISKVLQRLWSFR